MGAALVFLAFLTGAGSFLILHQIGQKTKTQITMDQLSGEAVIQLRAAVITLEHSRERLRIAKATMLSGCVFPPACPALTRAYELQGRVEEGIQKLAEAHWNGQKLKWYGGQPLFANKSSFPPFPKNSLPERLSLTVRSGSLVSTAELWSTPGRKVLHDWKIAWTQ